MRILTLDGNLMTSKKSMYNHLARVFSLPSYFGNNLDALWDLLNETNEPTKIVFLNVNQALEKLGSYGESFIRLLEKLEIKNNCYTIYLDE